MKRLVVLSLLVCALNSTLAFAERWVPIQIGGMTTYVNTVDFRATQNTDTQYTLSWLAWDSTIDYSYKLERKTFDPDTPITGSELPSKWALVTQTTGFNHVIDHDLTSFELGGLQQYRLSRCIDQQCTDMGEMSYFLDKSKMPSITPQSLVISMTPVYENEQNNASATPIATLLQTTSKRLNPNQNNDNDNGKGNPYAKGRGYSMLSGHRNPKGHSKPNRGNGNGHNRLAEHSNKNSLGRVVSNQALLTWDSVSGANRYMVVKTTIRADFPTKSMYRL